MDATKLPKLKTEAELLRKPDTPYIVTVGLQNDRLHTTRQSKPNESGFRGVGVVTCQRWRSASLPPAHALSGMLSLGEIVDCAVACPSCRQAATDAAADPRQVWSQRQAIRTALYLSIAGETPGLRLHDVRVAVNPCDDEVYAYLPTLDDSEATKWTWDSSFQRYNAFHEKRRQTVILPATKSYVADPYKSNPTSIGKGLALFLIDAIRISLQNRK